MLVRSGKEVAERRLKLGLHKVCFCLKLSQKLEHSYIGLKSVDKRKILISNTGTPNNTPQHSARYMNFFFILAYKISL